jgi:hypothetical protein
VPTYSLGQHFLGDLGANPTAEAIDLRMAVALTGHLTFFSDLRRTQYTDAVLDRARPWIDTYTANRELFTQMTYPLLDDPLADDWTALQTWDPEKAQGALLAFRQQSESATKTIALRNVPDGMTFDLLRAPGNELIGTVTSQELQQGIEVTLPEKGAAEVLLIVPASDAFDPTTVLTYDGPSSARVGSTARLSATLIGNDGPIPGALVSFTLAGATYWATTDASGLALVPVRLIAPPGSYEVVSSYAGSDVYRSSDDRDPFEITTGR